EPLRHLPLAVDLVERGVGYEVIDVQAVADFPQPFGLEGIRAVTRQRPRDLVLEAWIRACRRQLPRQRRGIELDAERGRARLGGQAARRAVERKFATLDRPASGAEPGHGGIEQQPADVVAGIEPFDRIARYER